MRRAIVTIYGRPGCHLCEEAKKAILSAGCEDEFVLEEINIDLDRILKQKYGLDVPIILINSVKVFEHEVNPAEFRRKLRLLA